MLMLCFCILDHFKSLETSTIHPKLLYPVMVCCGDIETNPGPKSMSFSTTCPICEITVAENHLSVRCSECNKSWHI